MTVTRINESDNQDGQCRLKIEGEMTIYTAAQLKEQLVKYVNDYDGFSFDLEQVTEIDSAGIQFLMMFKRKADQSEQDFSISFASEAVKEAFALLRVDHLIQQEASTVTNV